MFKASAKVSSIMFADDTNLFFSHANINEIFNTMNVELEKFNTWFMANKLSLNIEKTKYVFFHKPTQSDNLPLKLPNLFINNNPIVRTEAIKFLGIIIDENLSWKKHIKTIESKMACAIGLLYKTRQFLNIESRKLLYFSFAHSHLAYANLIWGATHPSKLEKLASQQRHICKVMNFKKRRDSARPIMCDMNITSFPNLNIYQVLIFMYRYSKKLLPPQLDNLFSPVHTKYNLRSETKKYVKLPKNTCKFIEQSVCYRGPKLWNSLSENIKKSHNLKTFKKQLKISLI